MGSISTAVALAMGPGNYLACRTSSSTATLTRMISKEGAGPGVDSRKICNGPTPALMRSPI